ncbi:Cell Wall Hydrolase [compost metagenome]|jgi:N-acetylmuramoyl-L-alanine amidase
MNLESHMNEQTIDVLARTLWGEARGEGLAGQIAVGHVIRNRVHDGKDKSWWGEGYIGVCRARWQFSCWNANDPNYVYLSGQKDIPAAQYAQAREAALIAMENLQPDPTGGATHYYVAKMKNPPSWRTNATRTCVIGSHVFFKNVP